MKIIHNIIAGGMVSLFSYLAILFIVISFILFYIKPVTRDRILARGIRVTIIMMLITIVIVPFALNGIALVCNVSANNMVGHDVNNFQTENLLISILYHFTDPGNLQEATPGRGLILAWVCALLGIFLFAGLMVSTIVNIMDRRTDLWKKGLIRYNRFFKDYVVIIGGNEQVVSVIKASLKNNDVSYVLILTSQNVEELRMRIESQLSSKEERKVVLYYGNQTSLEDIKALKIEKAKEIYILGESTKDDVMGDHDAFNMNSLQHISVYATQHSIEKTLKCHVAIEHQSTFTMLKYTDIAPSPCQKMTFLPFNVYELWAKRVIVDNVATIVEGKNGEEKIQIEYLPLGSREGIGLDSDKTVHIIIIGMNEMGTAFAMEAAQLMHFPNFTRDNSLRTRITFIDSNAVKESEFLKGRYANLFELSRSRVIDISKDNFEMPWYDPMKDETSRYHHLGANFMDIEWEFIQGNVASQIIRDYITERSAASNTLCTVAVCVRHPQQSLATALYLPELVLKRAEQILVFQRNMFDIVRELAYGDNKWKRYRHLHPFGMLENCYEDNSLDDAAPKLLDLFYRYRQEKKELNGITQCDIEKSEEIWKGRSIAFKWSSIYNVNSFAQKLRSAGSDINDTYENQIKALSDERVCKALALTEHNRWITERLMMGFRPLDNNEKEWQYFIKEETENPKNDISQKEKKEHKEYLKIKNRAHLDICSNETLAKIDADAPNNDLQLVRAMPMILKLSRETNAGNS